MDARKKYISLGDHRVYDQEMVYARAIGLLASSREIDFDDVLNYELAAYPPSMFSFLFPHILPPFPPADTMVFS